MSNFYSDLGLVFQAVRAEDMEYLQEHFSSNDFHEPLLWTGILVCRALEKDWRRLAPRFAVDRSTLSPQSPPIRLLTLLHHRQKHRVLSFNSPAPPT